MRKIAILVCAVAAVAIAQQPPTVVEQQPMYVTAIDVIADVRDRSGRLPQGLTPADFVLLEDGVERQIIGVETLTVKPGPGTRPAPAAAAPAPAAAPAVPGAAADPWPVIRDSSEGWHFVIYFENALSSAPTRKVVAEALMKQADLLVRTGRVDVVFANPTPAALIKDSSDPQAIRQALKKVVNTPGTNWLINHRRQFETQNRQGGMVTANIVPYAEEEIIVISRFRTHLMRWLASYGKHVPRSLILVTDGFDLNPADFYETYVAPGEQSTFRTTIGHTTIIDSIDRLSQALSAGNWMTVSVPGSLDGGQWLDDATVSGVGRVKEAMVVLPPPPPPNTPGAVTGATRPAPNDNPFSRTATQQRVGAKAMIYNAAAPLQVMAETTGGAVVNNLSKLGEAIDSIDDRLRITYQVNRPPDGKVHKVVIRAKNADLTVRSAAWTSSSTPQEMAEARAAGLLRDTSTKGDLAVESAITWEGVAGGKRKGMLFVTAPLDTIRKALPPGAPLAFRVTLAVDLSPRSPFVLSRMVTDHDQKAPTFRYRSPIDLPTNVKQMIVMVEEVGTGSWGSAKIQVSDQAAAK